MTNDEEILVKILKLSHDQVMAGKSYSQEEVELFLDSLHCIGFNSLYAIASSIDSITII